MIKKTKGSLKVVWAVDAFHENPRSQLGALQSLLKMGKGANFSIQPVAVLNPGSYDPVSQTFPENWHELAGAALTNLIDATEDVAPIVTCPARLLRVEKAAVSAAVDVLLQFALEENASVILVSTRARKGFDRAALGSFAETLVLRSPIPVLVVNPKGRPHQKLTTLLYPTDFSAASKKGLDRLISFAKPLGMQLLLFHAIRLPHSDASAGISLPRVSRESLRELKAQVSETASAWARRANHSGVRTKFHVDVGGDFPLDSILKISRRLGAKSMIAITSQSGPWHAALLGSLTRQVLRSADCPVLVMHAEQPSLIKEFSRQVQLAGYSYTAHPMFT